MIKLPDAFTSLMQDMFDKEEFMDFISVYKGQRTYALRANTLRIAACELQKILPFLDGPVAWTDDGFYYNPEIEPGKLSLKQTGLLYIQEPGAMYPVNTVSICEDEKILDLCASPGGKSLQIAAKLGEEGLLVCNDNNPKRISPLIKNIEQYGVRNSVIYNEEAQILTKVFSGYFDKVFIDVPCSGEGMFRKDRSLILSYLRSGPDKYIDVQRELLRNAALMTTAGGNIIYSTCTFNTIENEENILWFLDNFRDFDIVDIKKENGVSAGMTGLEEAARLWPHKTRSEGHFVCVLKKEGKAERKFISDDVSDNAPLEFKEFCDRSLTRDITGFFEIKGTSLHYMPRRYRFDNSIKPVKKGVFLGSIVRGSFEPSTPFILTLHAGDIQRTLDLKYDDIMLAKYLKGETLIHNGENGYTGILCEGRSVGWAKQQGSILKNCYPRTWIMNA